MSKSKYAEAIARHSDPASGETAHCEGCIRRQPGDSDRVRLKTCPGIRAESGGLDAIIEANVTLAARLSECESRWTRMGKWTMTEPTTAAGRAMFAEFGHPNFVEKWNAAILAIEAEARAAALDEARAAVLDLHRKLATAHAPGFAEPGNCRTCEALATIDALREGRR